MGLAVVWGTVKDHNGYINVQSEEGRGSQFTLYFPVTREEISAEAVPVSMSEYMGRGETILVVDDIKGQRELAADMLQRLNYRVSAVSSGGRGGVLFVGPCGGSIGVGYDHGSRDGRSGHVPEGSGGASWTEGDHCERVFGIGPCPCRPGLWVRAPMSGNPMSSKNWDSPSGTNWIENSPVKRTIRACQRIATLP